MIQQQRIRFERMQQMLSSQNKPATQQEEKK
jgi:hypothetical protein